MRIRFIGTLRLILIGDNADVALACSVPAVASSDIELLLDLTAAAAQKGGHIVIMSNGSFDGFHGRLLDRLARAS